MAKCDTSPYQNQGLENEIIWKPYGEEICDLKSTEKWDIPEKIVIKAAIRVLRQERRIKWYMKY